MPCLPCGGPTEDIGRETMDAPELQSPTLSDAPGRVRDLRCADCGDTLREELCGACEGPLWSLGVLENRLWLRCRNCGMEWGRPHEDRDQ